MASRKIATMKSTKNVISQFYEEIIECEMLQNIKSRVIKKKCFAKKHSLSVFESSTWRGGIFVPVLEKKLQLTHSILTQNSFLFFFLLQIVRSIYFSIVKAYAGLLPNCRLIG